MSSNERCGDYEIYKNEEGWWIVKNVISLEIIGKFLKKDDALEKIAAFMQEDETREESESVC